MDNQRYRADDLRAFAAGLLVRAGLAADRAAVVADILVEGDLLGKTTHGLHLLTPYIKNIANGGMNLTGQPETLADTGAAFTWDGAYLPGPWMVLEAMAEAEGRVAAHGAVTAVVRRAHHIGALQAYLMRATEKGLMMVLMASDPREAMVAPHGGIAGRYSPNPVAAGIPTEGDPILVDISASTTAFGVVMRARNEGRRLAGPWLKDNAGRPTDDPAARFTDPPGALLPLGGMDLGYKGFGLGILIEALTSALGGHGRADHPDKWGTSVFLQLFDPDRFAGADAFRREMSFLAESCRTAPVAEGDAPVRMPGDAALARRADQLANGVRLYPGIIEALRERAAEVGVEPPQPI